MFELSLIFMFLALVFYVVYLLRPSTERLNAVIEKLDLLNQTLEKIYEQSNIAIIVVKAKTGLIAEWSGAATILFHWTSKEMIGAPLNRIIPPEYLGQHEKAWAKLLKSGESPRRGPFEFMAQNKEGEKFPIQLILSSWTIETPNGDEVYFAANIMKLA